MTSRSSTCRSEAAAVLLEVVLALLLFVAAVAVVSSALNASMASVERQRLAMHAANLAATVHAELDLGIRSSEAPGPEPFAPPFESWTWELAQQGALETESGAGEATGLTRVEVVIRNTNAPTVFRLAQTHRTVKSVIQVQTNAPAATTEAKP